MVAADEIYREIVKCAGYSGIELEGRSRKREVVDRRVAVACVMFDMGCTQRDIARCMCRSSTSVRLSWLPLRMYVSDEIERIKEEISAANMRLRSYQNLCQ